VRYEIRAGDLIQNGSYKMDRDMTKQFIFTEVDGILEWGFTIQNISRSLFHGESRCTSRTPMIPLESDLALDIYHIG
jgi:hypothetical protein